MSTLSNVTGARTMVFVHDVPTGSTLLVGGPPFVMTCGDPLTPML